LVEAIEAAQDEDTLKLVANISLDGTLIIDKSINLDLNGHTIT
jgi:hypothetical protein